MLAASSVLCLPACGGTDVDAAGSGDMNMSGAGTGGSASAGQAPAGGSSAAGAGGSTLGGASPGGAGGAAPSLAACSSFMDSSGWTLVVQITNQRKDAVYLGPDSASCDGQRLFQVEDGSRTLLPSLDGCHNSCQGLMQTGPVTCPTNCAAPATITLNPGQTIKIPWDGRYAVTQSIPAGCSAAPSVTSCVQAQRIESSVFTFSARAGTSHSCMAAGGCSCANNEYGTCTTTSSVITGTIITTEYLVKLDPGQLSASGEPPFIGLTFKD